MRHFQYAIEGYVERTKVLSPASLFGGVEEGSVKANRAKSDEERVARVKADFLERMSQVAQPE